MNVHFTCSFVRIVCIVVFINTQTHKERIKEQLINIGYWFCKHIFFLHTGSTHCHMYSFTETVEAAKTLRKAFNNLVEFVLPMISELNVDKLKLRINIYIRDEQQITPEVRKHLDDLDKKSTHSAILNFLINRNFLGYLNYEFLEVFEGMVSSDELTSRIQEYKTDHDKFLQCTDFRTLTEVFKEKPELGPASAVGLPKFTLHLESQWEGRSTYSWKELLDKQFNWPPHVHVTSITRNCIIIEYSVLPFFAPAVVRDLTDPLVLAVLKRQGVTVKLSKELIEMGKEIIGPRNDVCINKSNVKMFRFLFKVHVFEL